MNRPDQEDNNRQKSGRKFVRERIVNRQSGQRMLKKLLVTGVCAVFFGLTAGIVSAAVFPAASRWFAPEESSDSITIPKDTQETSASDHTGQTSPAESAEAEIPGTEAGSENSEMTEEAENLDEDEVRALIAKMIDSALDQYSTDVSAVKSMYRAMALLGKTYNEAIVTVVIKDIGTDWFENEVETSGKCAGVIWNQLANGSIYILSCAEMPADGAEIQVIFHDGSRRNAVLCGSDSQTGMMVLKVEADEVDEELKEQFRVLPLGNSYTVTKGLPVLVIGSPAGDVGAVVTAVVTYTDGVLLKPDGVYRKMYLDCASAEGANGFVVSLEGEIMGVITPDTSGSVTGMIGISDLKGVLELLANGQSVPYLGIVGQSVTEELQETYGLPSGVYVNDVAQDSPAYRAGIKAGDVVVMIDSAEISSVRGMKSCIEGLAPGSEIPVFVKREGNGEYRELKFMVTPGLR